MTSRSISAEKRVTVHLAPADLRREGTGFDLPIAPGRRCAEQRARMNAHVAPPAIRRRCPAPPLRPRPEEDGPCWRP